jgi:hypothetical protein
MPAMATGSNGNAEMEKGLDEVGKAGIVNIMDVQVLPHLRKVVH